MKKSAVITSLLVIIAFVLPASALAEEENKENPEPVKATIINKYPRNQ